MNRIKEIMSLRNTDSYVITCYVTFAVLDWLTGVLIRLAIKTSGLAAAFAMRGALRLSAKGFENEK
jgi:hypothetical protein